MHMYRKNPNSSVIIGKSLRANSLHNKFRYFDRKKCKIFTEVLILRTAIELSLLKNVYSEHLDSMAHWITCSGFEEKVSGFKSQCVDINTRIQVNPDAKSQKR